MTDPKRLLSGEGDAFATSLLRSGRDLDAEQAHVRKLVMLSVAGGIAAASTAASGGALHGLIVKLSAPAAKWIAVGVVASAIGGGIAAYALLRGAPREGALAAAGVEVSAPIAALPLTARTAPDPMPAAPALAALPTLPTLPTKTATVDDVGSGAIASATPAAAAAPNVPSPAHTAASATAKLPLSASAPASPSAAPGLAEEVAALRAAREAVGAGQPKRALAALDAYSRQFPGGRLSLEAEVLRIEALVRAGESRAAAARAESFLAAHPDSPYAHRVRSLAPGAEKD